MSITHSANQSTSDRRRVPVCPFECWLRWINACCLFLALTFTLAFVPAGNDVQSLFPDNEEIEGWIRDGETYTATDEGSLSEFINGAAPFYIERGAQEVGFQDYSNGTVFLTVEIYRMGEQQQAEQLYADIHTDNPEPLDQIRGEGRFVGSYIGVYQIEFWQDVYFVRLNVSDKSEDSKKAVLAFTESVSEKIEIRNENE